LIVATALFLSSLLIYGTAMQLVIRVGAGVIRRGSAETGFCRGTAIMVVVAAITAAAHLSQVALWAVALLLCRQVSTVEEALYLSAQNYTSLGYDDIQVSVPWRFLGPLEAMSGIVFSGLSTAVLFAVMSRLIINHLRPEPGHHGEVAGNAAPRPTAAAARMQHALDDSRARLQSAAEAPR
jgi:hypothetical protein